MLRAYYEGRLSEAEGGSGEVTNPGEWPWAVLIFEGDKYVGAGVLMKSNVVVTTAPKVLKYLDTPGALTVRLGDFNPTIQGPNSIEDFPHLEKDKFEVRSPLLQLNISIQNTGSVL